MLASITVKEYTVIRILRSRYPRDGIKFSFPQLCCLLLILSVSFPGGLSHCACTTTLLHCLATMASQGEILSPEIQVPREGSDGFTLNQMPIWHRWLPRKDMVLHPKPWQENGEWMWWFHCQNKGGWMTSKLVWELKRREEERSCGIVLKALQVLELAK